VRVVIQRVRSASVRVDGEEIAAIGNGILVYVGIERWDGEPEIDFVASKMMNLRIFPNESGRMDRDIRDVKGDVLSVSQFTLASRIRKGRRPDFGNAAEPDRAESLYKRFNRLLTEGGVPVSTGRFGAMMDVASVNDGPVTFVIERTGGQQ